MRKAMLAMILVLALTGAACGRGGGSDCTSENATKLTGTLKIKGFKFIPDCFTVASGSTISVENMDARAHTFTVRAKDVDLLVSGGETGKATAPAPGAYDFVCKIHSAMTGTIIVT